MNSWKSDTVNDRQKALAKKLYEAGLLSKRGLGKVVE